MKESEEKIDKKQPEIQKIFLKAGESHSVGEGIRHNIANEQEEDLEYIYVVKLS